jgi:hypothetical protein
VQAGTNVNGSRESSSLTMCTPHLLNTMHVCTI